jgi:hypothetical protein
MSVLCDCNNITMYHHKLFNNYFCAPVNYFFRTKLYSALQEGLAQCHSSFSTVEVSVRLRFMLWIAGAAPAETSSSSELEVVLVFPSSGWYGRVCV